MITLFMLLLIAAILAFIIFAGGTLFTLVFGDVIVAVLAIWLIVRLFRRKK